MKACESYIEKIMESIDGELSEAEELELQQHMKSCEGCRALYESYRSIQNGILDMEEAPPAGLSGAVMGAIRQEKEKSSPIYYLKRAKFTLVAVAACLVVVVAGRFVDFGAAENASADTATMEMRAVAEEAAPEAPAEAPMAVAEGAALIPAYDGANTGETTTEEAPAEEAAESPETEAYAVEEAVEDKIGMSQPDSDIEAIRATLDALMQDGFSGDLVELFGFTEDMLYEKLPEAEKLELSDGTLVYRVSREQFERVISGMGYGAVVSTDTPGEDVFLYIG